MSIKQIQQLEFIDLSSEITIPDLNSPYGIRLRDDGNILSNFLFETSQFIEEKNEAVSYFKSKKLDGLDLSALLFSEVMDKIQILSSLAMELNTRIVSNGN